MPIPSQRHVRFAEFEADLRSAELFKGGRRVNLHQQPFQVLAILLEHPGELVTREELRRRLWSSDTFVNFDTSLNSAVAKLRAALHDSADVPRYVETLPRRGYRFIAPVQNTPAAGPESEGRLNYEHKDDSDLPLIGVPSNDVTPARRRHILWAIIGVGFFTVVLALQALVWAQRSKIARAIANEIRVVLTSEEQSRFSRSASVDPETYDLYLKGRYLFDKRTSASVRKSIEYFQQAVQRRPDYASAYAALAEAQFARTDIPPGEACSNANAAAHAALRIDDRIAEAHNALAACLFWHDWDWIGAKKEFEKALALNPNYSLAHQYYGQYQKAMGWTDWAAEVKRAGELDPLSPITAGGGWFLEAGQYDQAIGLLRTKLDLDPTAPYPNFLLGRAYASKGDYVDAISYLRKSLLYAREPEFLSWLGYVSALSGDRTQALLALQQLESLSTERYVSPYKVAVVYVGLGNKDLAFDRLTEAAAEHAPEMVTLNIRFRKEMDSLRTDPRFAALKHRIGLPQ